MKNMKISAKLIVSFIAIAALAAAVGLSGIIGMLSMNSLSDSAYADNTEPLSYISKIIKSLQDMRSSSLEYIIGALEQNAGQIENAHKEIEENKKSMAGYFDSYAAIIRKNDQELKILFDEARDIFEKTYEPFLDGFYTAAKNNKTGNVEEMLTELEKHKGAADKIILNFERCMELKIESASNANNNITKTFIILMILIIFTILLAAAISVFFALYISGLISRPLETLTAFMIKAGTTGDITLNRTETESIDRYSQNKDEIGQCIASTNEFVKRVIHLGSVLEMVAAGDLSVESDLLSDKDIIGISLKKMLDKLNNMFMEITYSTSQVTAAAKQTADGATALAQGAAEQAASLQQIASSVSDVAVKAQENTNMAAKSAELSNLIKSNAEKGSEQMSHMMRAVRQINEASHSISDVIKTIDNIAFQTSILALNASVEASHAGQYGKGFAIVAGEVRSLAKQSAEAAKNTAELIDNCVEKAEFGAKIADETAVSLMEIVSGVNESNKIANEIAKSSEGQNIAISQVNVSMEHVAQIVHQNSATAEESAASSEEMTSQADMLQELLSQFRFKSGFNIINEEHSGSKDTPTEPLNKRTGALLPASTGLKKNDFGKY